MAQRVRSLDPTTHTSLLPIRRGFAPGFVNYNKGCTRLAAASDKVYQLLAHGRWFSPASSTTKTGRHNIAEVLLKMVLKHQKSNQSLIVFASANSCKLSFRYKVHCILQTKVPHLIMANCGLICPAQLVVTKLSTGPISLTWRSLNIGHDRKYFARCATTITE